MNDDDLELTVYFDGACGLCQRVARWLQAQPKFVPLHCVAAQSAAAQADCPIGLGELLDRVTVTGSDGAVYRGANAWLVCLWALRNYRQWSLTLSSGALRPVANRLFAAVAGLAAVTKRPRADS